MPIIDIELVCDSESELADISAQHLADALGAVLGTEPAAAGRQAFGGRLVR